MFDPSRYYSANIYEFSLFFLSFSFSLFFLADFGPISQFLTFVYLFFSLFAHFSLASCPRSSPAHGSERRTLSLYLPSFFFFLLSLPLFIIRLGLILTQIHIACLLPAIMISTPVFLSERHRAVTTLGGVADEADYQTLRADIGARSRMQVKFYELPSPWIENADNKVLYGHEIADGRNIHILAVVRVTDANKGLLPKIGDKCVLTTNGLGIQYHEEPDRGNPEHLQIMAAHIQEMFQNAHIDAQGKTDDHHNAALKEANATRDKVEGEILELGGFDVEEVFRGAFYTGLQGDLVSYLDKKLIDTHARQDPSRRQAISAYVRSVADDLCKKDQETAEAQFGRIVAWLAARPEFDGETRWGNGKLEFQCTRIPAPPDVIFHHCLLRTTRPLQPNYPTVYKAPFLKIDFPTVAFPPNANQFSSDAFPDTQARHTEDIPGAVWCSVSTTPVTVTLDEEETSVKLMNTLPKNSDIYAWWRWCELFGPFPEFASHNLTKVFPGLATLADDPVAGAKILEVFTRTKAGKVMISGVPGSGKTHLTVTIAKHARTNLCYPSRGQQGPPVEKVDTAAVGTSNVSTTTVTAALTPKYDKELDGRVEGPKPGEEFMNRGLPAPTAPANGPTVRARVAPASYTPPAKNKSTVAQPRAPEKGQKVLIAVSAPAHAIIDDAYARFERIGAKPVKVYTYAAEMANLMRPAPEPRELLKSNRQHNATVSCLVRHINKIDMDKDDAPSARRDPRSLSNLALRIVPDDNRDKMLIMEGRQQQKASLVDFAVNKPEIKLACGRMLKIAMAACDIFLGTPVALVKLYNNTGFTPNLIILENAERWTESLLALPLACWPEVPTIMTGDPRQGSPVVPTTNASLIDGGKYVWRDTFGPQRKQSLLHRAVRNGAVDLYT